MQASSADVLSLNSFGQSNRILVDVSFDLLGELSLGLKKMSEQEYCRSAEGKQSSVGKHVRHLLEFYREYFRSTADASAGALCYDNRQRDIELENSLQAGLNEIAIIQRKLKSVPNEITDIALAAIVHPDQPAQFIASTSQRELLYLFDHTIHHMAIIKMLAEKQGARLPENFGLAPSTIAHEQPQ